MIISELNNIFGGDEEDLYYFCFWIKFEFEIEISNLKFILIIEKKNCEKKMKNENELEQMQ